MKRLLKTYWLGHLCDPWEAEAAVCEVHALPSSAAVEHLLSTGTDVLRPKGAGLSDEYFKMLVFLKGNFNK